MYLLAAFQAVRRVYHLTLGVQRDSGSQLFLLQRSRGQFGQMYESLGRRLHGQQRLRRDNRLGHHVRQRHVFAEVFGFRGPQGLEAHLVVADGRRDHAHRRYPTGVDGGLHAQPLHAVDALQIRALGHLQVDRRVGDGVHRRAARVVSAVRRIATVLQRRPRFHVDHQPLLLVPGHVLLGQPGRRRFRFVVHGVLARAGGAVVQVSVRQRTAVRVCCCPVRQLAAVPFRHVGRRHHEGRAHGARRTGRRRRAAPAEDVVLALGRRVLEARRQGRGGVQRAHGLRRFFFAQRFQAAVHVERRVIALGVARIRGTGLALVAGHRTSPVVSGFRASATTAHARPAKRSVREKRVLYFFFLTIT